ncbi:MAG: hypothetical protein E7214_11455 [Clostridium sp.]|nr:hypothetical protein [Clostridium sp.]
MNIQFDNIPNDFWKVKTIDKRNKSKIQEGNKLQNGLDSKVNMNDSDAPKLSVVSLHRDSSTGFVTQIMKNDILLDYSLKGKGYNDIMKAIRKENMSYYSNMSDDEVLKNIINR